MSYNLPSNTIGHFAENSEQAPSHGEHHQSSRKMDHLIKMNLPPLMGRRDAAYDRAREFINHDIFMLNTPRRHSIYEAVSYLLKSASDDTKAMLNTISSPDTEQRENKMLLLLKMLFNIAQALINFTGLESELFHDEKSPYRHLNITPNENDLVRNEKLLNETEISIAKQMCNYFEMAQVQVNRYRSYTSKSFSKSNAERYSKAYDAYFKLYSELRHEAPASMGKSASKQLLHPELVKDF